MASRYWLVYFLDQERGSEASNYLAQIALERPALAASAPVRRAAAVRAARSERNWAAFFRVLREAPYLVRCLVAAQYAENVRIDAFEVMGRSFSRTEPFPAWELAVALGLDSARDARAAAVEAGYGIDDKGDIMLVRTDAEQTIDGFEDEAVTV